MAGKADEMSIDDREYLKEKAAREGKAQEEWQRERDNAVLETTMSKFAFRKLMLKQEHQKKADRAREAAEKAERAKRERERARRESAAGVRIAEDKMMAMAAEAERQTIRYRDLSQYYGDFTEHGRTPHGEGEYTRNDGEPQYVGNWAHGYFHGTGKYYWEWRDSWEGNFVRGQMHGKGVYEYFNEDPYAKRKERGAMYYKNHRVCWWDELVRGIRIEIYYRPGVRRTATIVEAETVSNPIHEHQKHLIKFDYAEARWVRLDLLHFTVLTDKPQPMIQLACEGDDQSEVVAWKPELTSTAVKSVEERMDRIRARMKDL